MLYKQLSPLPDIITPGRWDTIAVVGMAPSSRDLIAEIPEDVGIFGLGASHRLKNYPRQMDVCIEIHPRWILEHPNYSAGLLEFVRQPHPFPVFMMEQSDDFPASVEYPLDLVSDMFLGKAYRGADNRQMRFFVSSFDYLMALALLYRPKRIEVIGYDMATDTEYRYQREGASFWIGIAAGLGIEVWLPDNCPVLKGKLYAYEGTRLARRSRVEELLPGLDAGMAKCEAEIAKVTEGLPPFELGQNPDAATREIFGRVGALRDLYQVYSGAKQTTEQLLVNHNLDDMISRQELELQRNTTAAGLQKQMSRLNWYEGIVRDRKVRFDSYRDQPVGRELLQELKEARDAQIKVRDLYFVHSGAVQLLSHLISECDLEEQSEFEPIININELSVDETEEAQPEPVA